MTEQELVSSIKTELGEPVINIEVSDTMIISLISKSIRKAREYLDIQKSVTFDYNIDAPYVELETLGLVGATINRVFKVTGTYTGDLDPFTTIAVTSPNYNLSSTLDVIIRQREIAALNNIVDRDIKITNGKVYIANYNGRVTIDYSPANVLIEDIKETYWQDWVYEYTLALTKLTLSRIRGKYAVDNSPYTTDAQDLRDEAQTSMTELELKLANDPSFVII